jgi:hypothetical protein
LIITVNCRTLSKTMAKIRLDRIRVYSTLKYISFLRDSDVRTINQ